MLSERISAIFTLLHCNNTEIARYAGCSSGNISKLKTGRRSPKSSSPSIASLASGIYGYADYENMLPALQELCGSTDTARETLLPALVAWLYETDEIVLPALTDVPKSKRARKQRRQAFGERLDRAAALLDLSNARLASQLSIDVSLVSRFRSGIYSPHGNDRLAEKLSDLLFSRAQQVGKTEEFGALCGVDAAQLNADSVAAWLYEMPSEEDNAVMAGLLLRSLDEFKPGGGLPSASPDAAENPVEACYFGTEGLRSAVIRFLSDAAREGGELFLYSDEPMDWMTGDRAYYARWSSLMAQCVSRGVTIKIIHNVDRIGEEMVDAIRGWLPLYVSGRIEPFVFRKERNARFYHTVFLRSGSACIHGFFPMEGRESRWYEYITDAKRLGLIEREYTDMLSAASPFLQVYREASQEEYLSFRSAGQGARAFLLSDLPVFTMPEKLLERILSRAELEPARRSFVLSLYRRERELFQALLQQDAANMILCLPEDSLGQPRFVNFGFDLLDLVMEYTQEEYAEHLAAITELVRNEKNFHLTLLAESPFREIQIAMPGDAVAVLRSKRPYGAFVFSNPSLSQSVSGYLSMLTEKHAADRSSTIAALEKLIR